MNSGLTALFRCGHSIRRHHDICLYQSVICISCRNSTTSASGGKKSVNKNLLSSDKKTRVQPKHYSKCGSNNISDVGNMKITEDIGYSNVNDNIKVQQQRSEAQGEDVHTENIIQVKSAKSAEHELLLKTVMQHKEAISAIVRRTTSLQNEIKSLQSTTDVRGRDVRLLRSTIGSVEHDRRLSRMCIRQLLLETQFCTARVAAMYSRLSGLERGLAERGLDVGGRKGALPYGGVVDSNNNNILFPQLQIPTKQMVATGGRDVNSPVMAAEDPSVLHDVVNDLKKALSKWDNVDNRISSRDSSKEYNLDLLFPIRLKAFKALLNDVTRTDRRLINRAQRRLVIMSRKLKNNPLSSVGSDNDNKEKIGGDIYNRGDDEVRHYDFSKRAIAAQKRQLDKRRDLLVILEHLFNSVNRGDNNDINDEDTPSSIVDLASNVDDSLEGDTSVSTLNRLTEALTGSEKRLVDICCNRSNNSNNNDISGMVPVVEQQQQHLSPQYNTKVEISKEEFTKLQMRIAALEDAVANSDNKAVSSTTSHEKVSVNVMGEGTSQHLAPFMSSALILYSVPQHVSATTLLAYLTFFLNRRQIALNKNKNRISSNENNSSFNYAPIAVSPSTVSITALLALSPVVGSHHKDDDERGEDSNSNNSLYSSSPVPTLAYRVTFSCPDAAYSAHCVINGTTFQPTTGNNTSSFILKTHPAP
eukprot:Tbor_TRINITY_DN939_c0_g1::TRINITY_DN939_c0_g1_i1::g.21147::m.21147